MVLEGGFVSPFKSASDNEVSLSVPGKDFRGSMVKLNLVLG